MSSEIVKTVYTYTILHRAGTSFYSLQAAMNEAFNGDAVGFGTNEVTTDVPAGKLDQELINLNSEPSFFDLD